jgi:putative glutamine amidotransferase
VVVEAVSSLDGVVEAIRWTGDGYARGLQWHPEFHHGRNNLIDSAPIMLDFLQAAAETAMRKLDDPACPDRRPPRAPLRLRADRQAATTAQSSASPK